MDTAFLRYFKIYIINKRESQGVKKFPRKKSEIIKIQLPVSEKQQDFEKIH